MGVDCYTTGRQLLLLLLPAHWLHGGTCTSGTSSAGTGTSSAGTCTLIPGDLSVKVIPILTLPLFSLSYVPVLILLLFNFVFVFFYLSVLFFYGILLYDAVSL